MSSVDMVKKFRLYYSKLSFLDLVRKIASVCIRTLHYPVVRKAKCIYYFKNSSINVGKNLTVHGLCFDISVGRKTSFYDNCVFEFGSQSVVHIGSNVVFSYGVVFCCRSKILIGDDVQIGEYTSIRDTTHSYADISVPMKYASDKVAPIEIGRDVWIGRGSLIMPGTIIEDGVVVGANSVVKGILKKNGIYAGTPARFIKLRTS